MLNLTIVGFGVTLVDEWYENVFFFIFGVSIIIQAGSKKYLSLALPLSIRNSIAQIIFLLATTY